MSWPQILNTLVTQSFIICLGTQIPSKKHMKAPTFSSGHPHPRPSSSKIETRGQPGQWPLPGQSPCSLVFAFIYNCRHRAVQQVPTGTALRRPSRAPIEKCYGEELRGRGRTSGSWGCWPPRGCQHPTPTPAYPSLGSTRCS